MDLSSFENSTVTLKDVLDTQARLEKEAGELEGGDFTKCTHEAGHVTQNVYSCLTCAAKSGQVGGVCAGCSVHCHTDHELVELLQRRNFQCDCGTVRLGADATCNLSKRHAQAANEGNRYDKGHRGYFCVCNQPYQFEAEQSTMYQCVGCEDWFHAHCVMPTSKNEEGELEPLLDEEDFDIYVCANCTTNAPLNSTVGRWKGAPASGVIAVGQDGKPHGDLDEPKPQANGHVNGVADGSDEPPAKRVKTDACKAPNPPGLRGDSFVPVAGHQGGAYLVEGFRERWCKCEKKTPYLLEEEVSHGDATSPDPDAGKSLEELGIKALNDLPRDKVIEGLLRYGELRDKLIAYLKTLGGEDHIVTKDEIQAFFAQNEASA